MAAEKRAIVAGILGAVCAVAVLGLVGLSQSTMTFAPALATAPATSSANNSVQNNQSASPYPLFGSGQNGGASLGSQSSQSIQSPIALYGAIILGGISLIVAIGAALFVSRKNI